MTTPNPATKPPESVPEAFEAYFHKVWQCSPNHHMHAPKAVRLAWEEEADIGGFWRAARRDALEEAAKFVENVMWPNLFDSEQGRHDLQTAIRALAGGEEER